MPFYTVGTAKSYSDNTLALAAILAFLAGSYSGKGLQNLETYPTAAGFYNESFNASTSFPADGDINNRIEANAVVNHEGVRNAGIYIKLPRNGVVRLDQFGQMHGYGITGITTASGHWHAVQAQNSSVLDRLLVYNLRGTDNRRMQAVTLFTGSTVQNTGVMQIIGKNFFGTSIGIRTESNTGVNILNCTVLNISGVTGPSANIGIIALGATRNVFIRNTYVGNVTDRDYWNNTGVPWDSENNFSEDATVGAGTGNQSGKAPGDQFEDPTEGIENLHLKEGADCIDAGQDISALGVVDDWIGVSRPQGSDYDVSASEFAPPGFNFGPWGSLHNAVQRQIA